MKRKVGIIVLVLVIIYATMPVIHQTAAAADSVPAGYTGIYTKSDLDNIRNDLSGKYILMNDITFTASDFASGGAYYNSGSGWLPIGSHETNKTFTGILDGNYHSISGLTVISKDSTDSAGAGLFASIDGATIKNLALTNASISGVRVTGGICGYCYNSTITGCIVSGSVSGSMFYVGGIAGIASSGNATGNNELNTSISNCQNLATLSKSGDSLSCMGGIAASVSAKKGKTTTLQGCRNSGSLTGSAGHMGGIVGQALGASDSMVSVSDCYNRGSLNNNYTGSGAGYAGGIAGSVQYVTINRCYNVGSTKGSVAKYIGGITGGLDSGASVSSSYYLTTSVNSANTYGTAASASDLKKQSTFSGWNFNSVWTMGGLSDYEYPELYAQTLQGTISIIGTPAYGETLSYNTSSLIGYNSERCTFSWSVGSSTAGTGSTYTIKSSDIGKTLKLSCISNDVFRQGTVSTSVDVTKAAQPNEPVLATVGDVTDSSISYTSTDGQEYSVDKKNWVAGGILEDLSPNKEYTVWTRIAETDLYYAGNPINCFTVTTEHCPITGSIAITGTQEYNCELTLDTSEIMPADATYSIAWTVDGNVVSTSNTYTTVMADIGKTVAVSIIGSGDYTGAFAAQTSEIEAKNLISVSFSNINDILVQTYTTKAVEPVAILKDRDLTLTKDVDYTISYRDNIDAGTAYITLSGIGCYRGEREAWFSIVPMDIDYKVECDPVAAVTYTGNEHTPVPSMHYNGYDLVEGTDFTCEYSENIKVGTGHITVTGMKNYGSSLDVTFEIEPRSISDAEVKLAKTEYTYAGSAITPTPIVTLDGKRLTPGTDYEIAYTGNTREGTATVIAIGRGNYSGSAKTEFTISGHYYGEWVVTKQATCTVNGLRYMECSGCGDRIEESIPATGHSYGDWIVGKQATCIVNGLRYKTCSGCGDRIEESIPATGHSYGDWIVGKQATCIVNGLRYKTCSGCGDRIEESIPVIGHSYGDWIVGKQATCAVDGLRYKECSNCGDRIEEVISSVGHNWGNWISAGEETHMRTCVLCGEVQEEPHDLSSLTCSLCGSSLTSLNIICDKVYTSNKDVVPSATCVLAGYSKEGRFVESHIGSWKTLNGTKFDNMDDISEVRALFIDDQYRPLSGYVSVVRPDGPVHQYSAVVTKAATCKEAGIRTYTCTICGASYAEKITKLAHTPVTDLSKPATCTESGLTAGSHCSVCGEVIQVQNTVPALGHNFVNGKCTRCGKVESESSVIAYLKSFAIRNGELKDGENYYWKGSDDGGESIYAMIYYSLNDELVLSYVKYYDSGSVLTSLYLEHDLATPYVCGITVNSSSTSAMGFAYVDPSTFDGTTNLSLAKWDGASSAKSSAEGLLTNSLVIDLLNIEQHVLLGTGYSIEDLGFTKILTGPDNTGAFDFVVDYVLENGTSNDAGGKYHTYTYNGYTYTIACTPGADTFRLTCSKRSNSGSTFGSIDIAKNASYYTGLASSLVGIESHAASFRIEPKTYTHGTVPELLKYDGAASDGTSSNELILTDLFSEFVDTALLYLQVQVLQPAGYSLRDLGFSVFLDSL